MTLLPQSIEEYVADDDPVRAYGAFVEALNFHEVEININPYKAGNAEVRFTGVRCSPQFFVGAQYCGIGTGCQGPFV